VFPCLWIVSDQVWFEHRKEMEHAVARLKEVTNFNAYSVLGYCDFYVMKDAGM